MFGNLGGLQISLLVPDEKTYSVVVIVGGISRDVFEQRTSTGSGPFDRWAVVLLTFACKSFTSDRRLLAIQIWRCLGILKRKRPHFRLTCVAQKRLCLSSLLHSALKSFKIYVRCK